MERRNFLKKSCLGVTGTLISPEVFSKSNLDNSIKNSINKNIIAISTWNVPLANIEAGKALDSGLNALDAVVKGVAVEEANIDNSTVGKGGTPDQNGNVSLDACVMNHKGNCGSVIAVRNITHVAALAKDVMEKTPHVILSSEGARKFALDQGYIPENLLTNERKKAWEKWLKRGRNTSKTNSNNHDTIGMICLDQNGFLSGACSTSGTAYKMMGRVGDSPIIGSGLYIDNKIGGAVATGLGEEVIKTVGSFLIVELMRQGMFPQQACEVAIKRILEKYNGKPDFQVAYLATNKEGEIGAYSIKKGFSYSKYLNGNNKNIISKYAL